MNLELLKVLSKPKLKAVSLIEVIVAIALIAIILTGGVNVFGLALNGVAYARQNTIAELLSNDLLELSISKRNEDWNSLVPGEYYFTENPNPDIGIEFTTGQETVDEFTRSVTISEVRRDDTSGDIVTSGGTVDDNTMKLDATTTWTFKTANYDLTLELYLTNWQNF